MSAALPLMAACSGRTNVPAGEEQVKINDYPKEVRQVVEAISKGDSIRFSRLVCYPLSRPYPLHNIENQDGMRAYYSTMVDDSLTSVVRKSLPDDWQEYGWRGWSLDDGRYIWTDDSIYAVPYTSQRELHMLDSLVKADLATLPPDLRNGGWRPVACFVEADGTQVFRIDRTSAKDGRPIYRMLTYDNFSDLEGQASHNMEGYMEAEGSAMNITYTFWGDDGTTYTLEPEPSDDSDATILISGPSHPDSQISVRPAYWLDLVKK